MNRKTKENKGFTFIEMLLSLVLLGFLSLVVGAGSTTALNVYRDGVGYAESRALSATLLMAMENDLRYAKDLRMEGDTVKFTSPYYGNESSFLVENGRVKVQRTVGESQEKVLLLGEKMYSNGLGVDSLAVMVDNSDTVEGEYGRKVTVTITMNDGNTVSTSLLNINMGKQ